MGLWGAWGAEGSTLTLFQWSYNFSHQISELLPSLPPESMQPLLSQLLDAPRWVRPGVAMCKHSDPERHPPDAGWTETLLGSTGDPVSKADRAVPLPPLPASPAPGPHHVCFPLERAGRGTAGKAGGWPEQGGRMGLGHLPSCRSPGARPLWNLVIWGF